MRHIDHVIDSVEIGGAERVVLDLVRLQTAAGASVCVHCLYAEGALGDAIRTAGGDLMVHGHAGLTGRLTGLARAFRARRPYAVHCHNVTATVLGAPLARLSRVPRVLATRHGLVDRSDPARERKFWLAAHACDYVVAVCEAARENLARDAGRQACKLRLIRNGAAEASGSALAAPGQHDRLTAVTVARLVSLKGHRVLIDGLAIARRDVPDLQLVIVGDGPERDRLEALVRGHRLDGAVQFVGEQLQPGRWLAAADLFALTSHTEGLPVALIEAFAAGLPSLVSDVGGMAELVRRSGVGVVVPVHDHGAVATALVHFARSRAELSAWGRRARGFYETSLTADRMHDDYWRLVAPAPDEGARTRARYAS